MFFYNKNALGLCLGIMAKKRKDINLIQVILTEVKNVKLHIRNCRLHIVYCE